jgi:hypothetical protein
LGWRWRRRTDRGRGHVSRARPPSRTPGAGPLPGSPPGGSVGRPRAVARTGAGGAAFRAPRAAPRVNGTPGPGPAAPEGRRPGRRARREGRPGPSRRPRRSRRTGGPPRNRPRVPPPAGKAPYSWPVWGPARRPAARVERSNAGSLGAYLGGVWWTPSKPAKSAPPLRARPPTLGRSGSGQGAPACTPNGTTPTVPAPTSAPTSAGWGWSLDRGRGGGALGSGAPRVGAERARANDPRSRGTCRTGGWLSSCGVGPAAPGPASKLLRQGRGGQPPRAAGPAGRARAPKSAIVPQRPADQAAPAARPEPTCPPSRLALRSAPGAGFGAYPACRRVRSQRRTILGRPAGQPRLSPPFGSRRPLRDGFEICRVPSVRAGRPTSRNAKVRAALME